LFTVLLFIIFMSGINKLKVKVIPHTDCDNT